MGVMVVGCSSESPSAELQRQFSCVGVKTPSWCWFMYLISSGAESLFVVPGVTPSQHLLPYNRHESKVS